MKAHSLSFHWWGSVCKSSECAFSCDVYKRTAALVDAKTRKSTEQQQLVANTKTERREVSRLAIWCHNIKKMAAFNISNGEIAELVGLSVATVEKLLALSVTDHAVQQTVKNGEVSVDVALQRVEEFGSKAAEKLEEDKAKAVAVGKKKVTRSLIAPEISVKKARRLVELITLAGIDPNGTISLEGFALAEVLQIVEEQKAIAANRG